MSPPHGVIPLEKPPSFHADLSVRCFAPPRSPLRMGGEAQARRWGGFPPLSGAAPTRGREQRRGGGVDRRRLPESPPVPPPPPVPPRREPRPVTCGGAALTHGPVCGPQGAEPEPEPRSEPGLVTGRHPSASTAPRDAACFTVVARAGSPGVSHSSRRPDL